MSTDTPTSLDHWLRPMEEIDFAIGQLSAACGMPLHDPVMLERLLRNDHSVCDHNNPRAFEKLRQLAMMHFIVTGKTLEALGPQQTQALADLILLRLRQRLGVPR